MTTALAHQDNPLVLVVDDDLIMRVLMRESLEQAGFVVEEAKDGSRALELFARVRPDVVLLDVIMPGMDGFDTCAALRQLPGGKRTPVLMTTGLDDVESIDRAYQVGATDFIMKPINWLILSHRVRYMLRASQAIEDLYASQEALRRAHADMETQVEERTAELSKANELLRQEIAQHQQAQEALRESEERSRLIIDTALDAVITVDADGVIIDWNAQAEAIFGWPRHEAIGRRLAETLIPAQYREAHSKGMRHFLATGKGSMFNKRIEITALHRDGHEFLVEVAISPLRMRETFTFSAFIRDITERKRTERLKDELVSTVSHELRTPLTSLRGFAELMLKREFPAEKQRQFLTIIHSESLRLTNLINDFLDLQRMESGRQTYTFAPVDLVSLLHDVLAVLTREGSAHTFRLEAPTLLPSVRADADRVRQILVNLLSNAVKFSPEGGEITVGVKPGGAEVVIHIADQGIGIPAEIQPNLFSKFFRVDNTMTRSIGGTGLGLAIVKEIVTAHGGLVWVESKVGVGSTFFFTLPIIESTPAPVEQGTRKMRARAGLSTTLTRDGHSGCNLL
jgi:PAS domain S-box-containing protein